ncbi:hypothetical protein A3Q56_07705, partial [Intoshia linei]
MSRIAPQWSRIKKIENTNLEYDNLEKISDVRFSNDTLSTNLTSHIKSKANAIDEVEFSNRHLIEKYKAENNNLENNMKFIKTKHSEMLILLQNEIDTLKNRNKVKTLFSKFLKFLHVETTLSINVRDLSHISLVKDISIKSVLRSKYFYDKFEKLRNNA